MGLLSWLSNTNITASAVQGTVSGVLGGIGSAANGIREAITGKLSPDDQAKFDMEWQALTQKLQEGQQAINLADANSGSNFRGGWRPMIGWVCALALFFYYIPPVFMATVLWTIQCVAVMLDAPDIGKTALPAFPLILDVQEILGLVASLLGLAGMRSYEKKNNVG